jgi:N-acetylmuramoyl-L-alanine amidase
MRDVPSPNHDARPPEARVALLVLHYTGMPTGQAALERLCDPAARVSAHYMVEEDGRVLRLVPEHRRAWHAGRACWQGRRDINARSIGVEIVNPGHEFGYRAFPEPQMAAVVALCTAIAARHGLGRAALVGHSDVAPTRKEDPGELFDWSRLARAGLGVWPVVDDAAPAPAPAEALAALAAIGYDLNDAVAAVRAFQRRYRPAVVDGVADAATRRRACAVRTALAAAAGSG